jgi:hypothetical protein
MSWAGLLILGLGGVVLAALIFGPVLQRSAAAQARAADDAYQRERDALKLSYQAVLNTLRDLEEDYATGKLTDEDYQAEKARWQAEGVRILKDLARQKAAAGKS